MIFAADGSAYALPKVVGSNVEPSTVQPGRHWHRLALRRKVFQDLCDAI
ncbi:hypothetical protein KAK07_21595 [Ideonella sp. 4Y16]|nr:hypothetical protein [Ideonella alba]MBQ0945950.1 hypothetical protein [Ideonella alba]